MSGGGCPGSWEAGTRPGGSYHLRSHEQIGTFFDGLDVVQSTEKLTDVFNIIEDLIAHREIFPTELLIKLETLRAGISAVLEDRQDADSTG